MNTIFYLIIVSFGLKLNPSITETTMQMCCYKSVHILKRLCDYG